jgi:hypothetical protein
MLIPEVKLTPKTCELRLANLERKTIISSCRQYRYCLWREWDTGNRSYAMFIGLNPSTADEVKDDPTIRRCMNFAKRWGYGALCMVNLFAYRETEPRIMKIHPEPIGIENDERLVELANGAGIVIAAWGANGKHLQRDQEVMRLLKGKLYCLGKTISGHPKHPLYLKSNIKPFIYS